MEIPRKFGKYNILSVIGQGSMGTVCKAEQDIIRRIVAIKVLPVELAREDKRKQLRFEYEAKAAARLFHPSIITIFEIGKLSVPPENINYIVMQYFKGESLSTLIEGTEGKKLPLMTALSIFEQMASALDHAHTKNVVHRDIKPSNIMVSSDWKAKLLDFGIAKIVNDDHNLTKKGYVIGSAPYMSPEQARGEKVDGRSDIFSLGVVVYEAFTGQRAFFAKNKKDMIFERQKMEKLSTKRLPTKMRLINPEIPTYLEEIVHKCMQGNPKKRYQAASELLEDITKCKLLILCERKFYNLVPKYYYLKKKEHYLKILLSSAVAGIVFFVIGKIAFL